MRKFASGIGVIAIACLLACCSDGDGSNADGSGANGASDGDSAHATSDVADTGSQPSNADKCLHETICLADQDCGAGARCNFALDPPQCQAILCSETGAKCSASIQCDGGPTGSAPPDGAPLEHVPVDSCGDYDTEQDGYICDDALVGCFVYDSVSKNGVCTKLTAQIGEPCGRNFSAFSENAPCAAGGVCLMLDVGAGICVVAGSQGKGKPCEPFGSPTVCAPDLACVPAEQPPADGSAYVCDVPRSDGSAGSPCQFDFECNPELRCDGNGICATPPAIVDRGDFCDDAAEDCGKNGYCCWLCDDGFGNPTDVDCNPNTPFNSDSSSKNPSCGCDYWGFICEAKEKPSTLPCECDPDCTFPDGSIEDPCVFDSMCDTYCPAGSDPDC